MKFVYRHFRLFWFYAIYTIICEFWMDFMWLQFVVQYKCRRINGNLACYLHCTGTLRAIEPSLLISSNLPLYILWEAVTPKEHNSHTITNWLLHLPDNPLKNDQRIKLNRNCYFSMFWSCAFSIHGHATVIWYWIGIRDRVT